jgi:hypothetical protein
MIRLERDVESSCVIVNSLDRCRAGALSRLPAGNLCKSAHGTNFNLGRATFEKHEAQTEQHVTRLEKVFAAIDETPKGKTCDAIMGLIEEGQGS